MDNQTGNKSFSSIPDTAVLKENIADVTYTSVDYRNGRGRVADERIPLDKAYNYILKRSLDIIISLVLITVLLSWLIPILAILIKLDSKGPVFFYSKKKRGWRPGF